MDIKMKLLVFAGGEEMQRGRVKLKNMATGEEKELSLDAVLQEIQGNLA